MKIELSHDLIAKELFIRFSEEEKVLRKATSILVNAYGFHREIQHTVSGNRWLTKGELHYIEPFLDQLNLKPEIRDYFYQSKETRQKLDEAETLALKAKIKAQNNLLILAVIAFTVTISISAIAVRVYLHDLDTTGVNETLKVIIDEGAHSQDSLVFRNAMLKGDSLYKERRYQAAEESFCNLLKVDSSRLEVQHALAMVEKSRFQWWEYQELVEAGEEALRRNDLRKSYNYFQKAKKFLFNENKLTNLILTLQKESSEQYNELTPILEESLILRDCELAETTLRKINTIQLGTNNRPFSPSILELADNCPKIQLF